MSPEWRELLSFVAGYLLACLSFWLQGEDEVMIWAAFAVVCLWAVASAFAAFYMLHREGQCTPWLSWAGRRPPFALAIDREVIEDHFIVLDPSTGPLLGSRLLYKGNWFTLFGMQYDTDRVYGALPGWRLWVAASCYHGECWLLRFHRWSLSLFKRPMRRLRALLDKREVRP